MVSSKSFKAIGSRLLCGTLSARLFGHEGVLVCCSLGLQLEGSLSLLLSRLVRLKGPLVVSVLLLRWRTVVLGVRHVSSLIEIVCIPVVSETVIAIESKRAGVWQWGYQRLRLGWR